MYEGKYYIDDKDIYTEYGVVFEKDAFNELLKFPEGKGGYAEEWHDAPNDFLAPLDATVESLSITVPFLLIANDRNDFLSKYNRFKNFLVQQKYFNLDVVDLAMRFKLRYKNMPSFSKITPVTKMQKVACKLSLTLVDDFPLERSMFEDAIKQALAQGYTVDREAMAAGFAEMDYEVLRGKPVLALVPGLYRNNYVAGFGRDGLINLGFNRLSTATYWSKDKLLTTAAINEPRINYNPHSGKCEGYIVESGGVANLVKTANSLTGMLNNGDFSIRDSNIVFPDALKTPATLIGSGTGTVFEVVQCAGDTHYTYSAYYKLVSGSFFSLIVDGPNGLYVDVRVLASGEVVGGGFTCSSVTLHDGWHRFSVTFKTPVGQSYVNIHVVASDGDYALFGRQLEVGQAATSFIYTNGAAAVRASENIYSLLNYSGENVWVAWAFIVKYMGGYPNVLLSSEGRWNSSFAYAISAEHFVANNGLVDLLATSIKKLKKVVSGKQNYKMFIASAGTYSDIQTARPIGGGSLYIGSAEGFSTQHLLCLALSDNYISRERIVQLSK